MADVDFYGSVRFYGEVIGADATSLTLPANCITDTNVSAGADLQRSKFLEEALVSYPIDMSNFRVWDAMQTLLSATAATDDLAFVGGTFGTDQPMIKTGDLGAAGATTRRCRFLVALPAEYVSGGDVQIRVAAKMDGTQADTSCTLDVEAYEVDKNDGVGADLVSTAAQDMNDTTIANYDFTVTATALARGDWLDVRLSIAVNDGASYAAIQALVCSVELRCDIKG